MALWHPTRPHGLQEDEPFAFTLNKHKVSVVTKREFDSLSPVEAKTHRKEVAEAKLADMERWQDLNCFRRMP
eukprot:12925931-Prorocentrum_lima.AAC.1